jgi:hypothetical protein
MQKFRRSPSLSSTCFLCAVPLCWLHNFTRLLCRCRREYRVFQKLLGMVPHLGDRLMDYSNEESMAMADLVCPLQSNIISFLLLFITDSERCLYCQVGRHQEYEKRSVGLDNPPRCPAKPASFTQCQDKPWIPPQRYRGSSLPRWCGLG